MIDYDKLKIAHELCDKLTNKMEINVCIRTSSGNIGAKNHNIFSLQTSNIEPLSEFKTIDDLIIKLRELTQPEPKYHVGDIVWIVIDGQPKCIAVQINIGPKYYLEGHVGLMYESELYPTKADLIEAQIEYWSSQREPFTCEHCGCLRSANSPNLWCCDLYASKRTEYCNISGAKLGKHEECECNTEYFHTNDGRCVLCNKPYKEDCEHESDGEDYRYLWQHHYKCIKCGDFYR